MSHRELLAADLNTMLRQKEVQGLRLGQHTEKACTEASPAPSAFSGSTEHSARGSWTWYYNPEQPALRQEQSGMLVAQNPRIAGSADPSEGMFLGTYPSEPLHFYVLSGLLALNLLEPAISLCDQQFTEA